MNAKYAWYVSIASLSLCGYGFYTTWQVQAENQKLSMVKAINDERSRLLADELRIQQEQIEDLARQVVDAKQKPSYESGYKDAIVRMGGPQTPGAYQDGWDDALKTMNYEGYADGYHTAIKQFGYSKTSNMVRWLVPDLSSEKDQKQQKEGGTTTKLEKK